MTALELGWPVGRAGAAVVSPSGVETAFQGGVSGGDQFEVASVTKLMTSLAALAAVESGRIDLDEPVPQARDAGAAEGVTLRHLLAHAGGFPFEPPGRPRPPEQRRIYSNVGFRLLADAVADAAGTTFAGWLSTSVLDPLEMSSTRLVHRRGIDGDPAAGAASTLDDLVRLARCLLDQGAPVVGPELFAEAVSVQFPGLAGLVPGVGRFDPCDWGLGFELKDGKRPHWMGDRRSPSAFGHFGASGCFLWVDPGAGLAAAAVSDREFADDKWGMATWPAWSDRLGG
ncbi:MAG: penicillin-binding protein beta-lactamase class [Actinomycetia bacterium]|jgi:CubicO group peptidase (beta-lactamase class C family)|nr:penicillin-binding protein beta-lactamase class [Actinomycetes bacterium]